SVARLLPRLLDLSLELAHELVDRRLHVGRRLPGAHNMAARPDGRLGHLVGGNGGIRLLGELQLDPGLVVEDPFELAELALPVAPDRLGDLGVLTLDAKLHVGLRSSSLGNFECIYRTAGAKVTPSPRVAPARRRADAAAAAVEPLV